MTEFKFDWEPACPIRVIRGPQVFCPRITLMNANSYSLAGNVFNTLQQPHAIGTALFDLGNLWRTSMLSLTTAFGAAASHRGRRCECQAQQGQYPVSLRDPASAGLSSRLLAAHHALSDRRLFISAAARQRDNRSTDPLVARPHDSHAHAIPARRLGSSHGGWQLP